MARVIFVNRFYWPDEPATGQLLTDLAEALVRLGHAVTVIASRPAAAAGPVAERNGVTIVHVGSTRGTRGGLVGKALDWGTFLWGGFLALRRLVRPDTIVVAMTDPPLLALVAWAVARSRRAPLIHWVQDIYPEIAIALTGHGWLRVLRPWRNRAWRDGRRCVTIGHDMAARLARAGVPPERQAVISNWAPQGVSPQPASAGDGLRAEWNLTGKFVVGYSGNLGRVHDLEPVLALAAGLHDDPRVSFVIVGSGAQRAHLAATARRRGLKNVSFQPPQPRQRLAETLAVADVHLVTLRPECADLVFPSKLFGVTGAGRPVLFIGPPECEVARCVRDNGFGFAAAGGDLAALTAAIRHLQADAAARAGMAAAAVRFASRHGPATAAAHWDRLLQEVSAES
jgi:glycosyltransferase involved in cell wall biosynthesis